LGPDSNPYRYVHNGPADATDPSGLEENILIDLAKRYGVGDDQIQRLKEELDTEYSIDWTAIQFSSIRALSQVFQSFRMFLLPHSALVGSDIVSNAVANYQGYRKAGVAGGPAFLVTVFNQLPITKSYINIWEMIDGVSLQGAQQAGLGYPMRDAQGEVVPDVGRALTTEEMISRGLSITIDVGSTALFFGSMRGGDGIFPRIPLEGEPGF